MRLGVNIDHIATIREIRHGIEPEPVVAASLAEAAGADSIVTHLREDRRHIRESDLYLLKQSLETKLNLEMSVARDIVDIACKLRPERATLVPEKRRELTTEGGLDVAGSPYRIKAAVSRLKENGIEVSLFIDPDKKQIDASLECGVKMVELHTGRYADARGPKEKERRLKEIKSSCAYARSRGFEVFAGHGLDYHNVSGIAAIRGIEELNIGYSLVCRAALVGLKQAVREMKELIG
ncbi:MAG: pyridoxine 5'-phosphate synthase [Candidatus Omnitrophota bacterium]